MYEIQALFCLGARDRRGCADRWAGGCRGGRGQGGQGTRQICPHAPLLPLRLRKVRKNPLRKHSFKQVLRQKH